MSADSSDSAPSGGFGFQRPPKDPPPAASGRPHTGPENGGFQSLPRTAPTRRRSEVVPSRQVIIEGKGHAAPVATPSKLAANLELAVYFAANLLMLSVPVLIILLLSVWFPTGTRIDLENFSSYIFLAIGVTAAMVVVDTSGRALTRKRKAANDFRSQMILELVSWGVAALVLMPFTELPAGAFAVALLIALVISPLSRVIALLFKE